jgi:hypothetical protein
MPKSKQTTAATQATIRQIKANFRPVRDSDLKAMARANEKGLAELVEWMALARKALEPQHKGNRQKCPDC